MFGKGIYTSDMVSKSANYCFSESDGILVLCDVALGEIQELKKATNIRKPDKGKHSVKGKEKFINIYFRYWKKFSKSR